MKSSLREGGGMLRQKWDVIGRRGGRLASVLDVQPLFFIKENWICDMTRNHAEPNINTLLTRNILFDSDVRQWSHPLMIPLHCLWARSKNSTGGEFECDLTWFRFCFDFVRSHARSRCFSIVKRIFPHSLNFYHELFTSLISSTNLTFSFYPA